MPSNVHELPTNSLDTIMRSLSMYHRANVKDRTTMRRHTKIDTLDMFNSYPRQLVDPLHYMFQTEERWQDTI